MKIYYYFNYQVVVKDNNDKYIVDQETGEKITDIDEINKKLDKVQIDGFHEGTRMKNIFDIAEERRIQNRKSLKALNAKEKRNRWKMDSEFVKVFKDFNINDLLSNEKVVLFSLLNYIEWNTNRIRINGDKPKKKELIDIIGLGKNTLPIVLKEMDKKKIIKLYSETNYYDIYINPEVLIVGDEISEETLKMFE